MKNTSSLFLTLVSYLIMLATILFLLFAAIPLPLKAQTNADMVATNAAVTNAASQATFGAAPTDTKPSFMAMLPGTLALFIPIIGIVMGCSIVGLRLYLPWVLVIVVVGSLIWSAIAALQWED